MFSPLQPLSLFLAQNSKLPNEEFNRARLQVLNEIRLAPERHNDNAVATMEEAAKKLLMLYRVCAILPYRIPSELKWAAAAASGVALAVSAGVKKNKCMQFVGAVCG